MAAGVKVHDIGLALSPMAYFAQFALDCPAVAMVTASHNDNGWTGVKMGAQRPVTFGPDEMGRLQRHRARRQIREAPTAAPIACRGFRRPLSRRSRQNGRSSSASSRSSPPAATARRAPSRRSCWSALGCEVVPLDTELDYTFPHYNPNPEDLQMLHAMADKVRETGADVGLGFDGDGDRCGVVDNNGEEIFADKIGVMLARDLSQPASRRDLRRRCEIDRPVRDRPGAHRRSGVKADYWKTGHSYIKRRVTDLKALAGFEKSGHFFFNAPVGRGYDDGLLTALHVLEMLDRNPAKTMADLYAALPKTWGSPTMSPHCADENKYGVVDKVIARFKAMQADGEHVHRPDDPRSRHRQRRARDGRGRHLGPRARLLQQARTRRRRRKPGVGSAHARRCSRPSTRCCARTRKSARITRRFEGERRTPHSEERPQGASRRAPALGIL